MHGLTKETAPPQAHVRGGAGYTPPSIIAPRQSGRNCGLRCLLVGAIACRMTRSPHRVQLPALSVIERGGLSWPDASRVEAWRCHLSRRLTCPATYAGTLFSRESPACCLRTLHGGVLSGDGAREWPGLRLGHSRGEGREGGVVSVVLRAYQGMFLRGPAPSVANVVSLGRAGKGVELVF